jgi:O-succinylbenzoate synthase
MKKTPCKKPRESQSEPTEFRIVWDHQIHEKIFELEAKILTYTIIGGATLFVSICNLVALIIKK